MFDVGEKLGVGMDEGMRYTWVEEGVFMGYGNISPITRGGQSFAIVYAIVGIPLCGLVLAQLGTRLNAQTQKLEDRFAQALERHDKPAWLAKLANILVLVLILLFFLIIPAVIFMVIEGWGYQEAWYYCFVTLTTIGFGDYVVGTNPDIHYTWVYKWLVYVWIFFGLVNMATIITKITDWMSEKAENSKIGGRPSKEGEPPLSPESSSDDRTKEEKGGEDVEMTKVNGAEI
ncbi:potassium channel, subfamily K, member 16-like [Diadema antillarum]|uniref:potassium channel, subfamily K, member 16-like n=1 Tax=Diadema antillarum TaxID=105358 RepID=UPI003A848939